MKTFSAWTSILTLLVLILSSGWAQYQLTHMYGGHTKVVDSSSLITQKPIVAIIHANVLSPDASQFILDQTVILDKGKISALGNSLAVPQSAQVVDGSQLYLMPGLIDSHVHLWQSKNDLLLYISQGVTSVREMMGSNEHLTWRNQIDKDELIGPHLFVASNKVNTYGYFQGWFMQWSQGNINLTDPHSAKKLTDDLESQGYQAIKVGSSINAENYFALSKASENSKIPLIGHLPNELKLKDVWASNQSEIAHVEELVKKLCDEFGPITVKNQQEFLTQANVKADEIATKLAERNIAVTSTLELTDSFPKQEFELKNYLKTVALKYENPGLIEGSLLTSRALGWLPENNPYRPWGPATKEQMEDKQAFWFAYNEASRLLVKAMVNKGVKLMAGTDANIPTAVPGFSLHQELIALKNTGLTESQVIASATITPSEWMKTKTGKIETGYNADLILLEKNPLEDIKNIQSINGVFVSGRYFSRSTLDTILRKLEAANQQSRTVDIKEYL